MAENLKNKFSLILLHNEAVAASRDTVVASMTKVNKPAGSPIVGFYNTGGVEKAVLGLFGSNKLHTIDLGLSQADIDALKAQVDKLDGEVTVEGSVKKQIKDAIDGLRNEFESADKTVTITKENSKVDFSINIDGATIVKDENGVLSVASSAITVSGKEAIEVTTGATGNEVSLKIKEDDKVLSQSANGLEATLSLDYDSTNKKVVLKGKNNTEISSFDATKFIKDGMLESAEFVTKAEEGVAGAPELPYIKLTFKLNNAEEGEKAKDPIRFSVKDLVDTYVAGNGIELVDGTGVNGAGKAIQVKLAEGSEAFLSVDANGLKLSGVQGTINGAIKALDVADAAVENQYVSAVSETDGKISVTRVALPVKEVKAGADDAHVEVDTTDSVVTITSKDVASDAELATVEAAIGLSEAGGHVATTGKLTSGAATIAGEIKALEDAIVANKVEAADKSVVVTEETGESAKTTIKVNIAPSTEEIADGNTEFLKLGEKGLYVSNIIDCGTY